MKHSDVEAHKALSLAGRYARLQIRSQQGWDALLEQDLEFCRPCLLAMKVWSHRKAIHRRRASVLGSIKRIGVRQMSAALQSGERG